MPSWGQILNEIQASLKTNGMGFDALSHVRNKYLSQLSQLTGRDTIIYASRWTQGDSPPQLVSINEEDVHAFMEALYGLDGKALDLILHTGGGSAETAEALISYLRQKYDDIRAIVPQAAMSAGTMLACAGNTIVMGKQSSLGPIDPQIILQTQVGLRAVPAHAILDQFEMAKEDCGKNPKNLGVWMPMLSQYGPALLIQCKNHIRFSKELVEGWLSAFMFKGETTELPSKIANYLSDHGNFNTHSKHVNLEASITLGLKIQQLESDQNLQEAVLSAFHATMHSFGMSPAAKIVANHKGNCYIKMNNIQLPKKPSQASAA